MKWGNACILDDVKFKVLLAMMCDIFDKKNMWGCVIMSFSHVMWDTFMF